MSDETSGAAIGPAPVLGPDVVPPMRIEFGDLIVRRWEPEDLQARFDAIVASYEQLHQWMEWAAEPPGIEQQREFGERQAAGWPVGGSFSYGIFDAGSGAVLGAVGLHDHLGQGAVEIGYWCHVEHTGRGVITRAAARLTRAAFDLAGVGQVEIHCDEANVRSAAVPRRLGYRLDRIELDGIHAPAEVGRGMVWVMERKGFASSAAERISG